MNSIFREKRIVEEVKEIKNEYFQNKHSDNGVLRARNYSLTSVLHFTGYSGLTIKELIETNFDYFTWLPRNIENFRYEPTVLKYARESLDFLEKIENFPENKSHTELGKAIDEVTKMLEYEYHLDFGDDENLLNAYKAMIDVKYYKTKIINTSLERFIRQSLDIKQNSNEYRRKYFEEINTV